ncbi:MAG: FkbM family methyltransferase [Mesorhizobium sp.]|nr:FkbM family methyltransferase [Mesorhizobium sp.]MBL8578076.1 FkbM family methyltransferase [Mesorhizobium sp.]
MFKEGRLEFMIRWHGYRRWKRRSTKLAEYKFYKLMDVTPPGIFVDLGANFGTVSGKALDFGHKVYAFEPDPHALSRLRKRIGNNPNATIIPKAVGNSSRTAKFFRRPDADAGDFSQISSLMKLDVHDHEVEVEVVDIVEFLRGLPEPPAVVKMDIEGGEAECLEAILDAGLHTSIGHILVETHERFSTDIAARIDRVRDRIEREKISNIDLNWI